LYPSSYKVDVIVPTADISKWPAKHSLKWNMEKAKKNYNVKFIPIESSGSSFSFSKSINEGIDKARYDSDLFLLNDDCFMDSFWIERLFAARISHPECGIFGALLRFPDKMDMVVNSFPTDLQDLFSQEDNLFSGRKALNHWHPEYQFAGGYIPLTTKEMIYGLIRFGFWNMSPLFLLRHGIRFPGPTFRLPGHYHNLNPKNRIDLITAAAMLITWETLGALGNFEEQLPLSFNDTDYSLRALEDGISLCLVSDCTGVHYESLTTRHLESDKRNDYHTFYNKWPAERLKSVIRSNKYSIVHPKFCRCGDWAE